MKFSWLLFVTLLFSIPSFGKTYYVSTNGNNHSKGSFDHPFRSIQFAVNKLKAGDKCLIRKGTYFENIHFKNSGTAEQPIIVRSYQHEKVVIKPHRVHTLWKQYKGKIFRTRINDSVIQLFTGNKSLMQAAYPSIQEGLMNTSNWLPIHSFPNKNIILKSDKKVDVTNAHFIGLTVNGLIAINGDVISQKNNSIFVESVGFYWNKKYKHGYHGEGKGYFVGKLSFLNKPGEWFSDGKFLYYWPKKKHPKEDDLTFRTKKNTIILNQQEYIQLNGIEVIGGCISLVNSNHCSLKSIKVNYPVSFFTFNCGFSRHSKTKEKNKDYFEGKGIEISGNHNSIEECTISKSWGDGLTVEGSNNHIQKCRIFDCDWMGIDCSPIFITGFNHVVKFCDFSTSGRSIFVHHMKNGKVKYNKIHNGGLLCDDLGLTYCYNSDGGNTEIAYNWVYENHAPIYGAGIYIDNHNSNYNVHHNVVWDCFIGMTLNQTSKNVRIDHNTFWGNKYTMSSFHPEAGKREITNVICSNNLTDSELSSIFQQPFIGSDFKNNSIVESVFNVLENPKECKFYPKNNQELSVGAYATNRNYKSPGIPEEKKQESTTLPILLFTFYFALILFAFRKISLFQSLSFKSNSALFLLKVGFGFAIYGIYTFYYPNRQTAEIFKHFDDAKQLYLQLIQHHPSDYFKFIVGLQENNSATNNALLTLQNVKGISDLFLIRLHCILQLISVGFYPIHLLFFGFMSYVGSLLLFKTYAHFFPTQKGWLLIGIFGLPSVLFWTSGTLEDTLLLFFIGLFSHALLNISLKKVIVLQFLYVSISLLVVSIFRPYLIIALVPILLYFSSSLLAQKHSYLRIILCNILILISLLTVQFFIPSVNLLTKLTYVQSDLINVANEMHAHSILSIYLLDGTISSFIHAIPSALYNVFITPISTHSTWFIYLSSIENVGILVILLVGIIKIKSFNIEQRKIILLVGCFCLFVALFIGWTIPIGGLISRYKSVLLQLIFPLVVISFSKIFFRNKKG